jgi:acyl transferase domain-containing protein
LTGIDLANFNTPTQIVLSGPAAELRQAAPLFEQGRMLFYPLNTSGAFHSRYMRPARDQFRTFLQQFELHDPKIPVIANFTGQLYESGRIVETLSEQIASPVRWEESIRYLVGQSYNGVDAMQFEEVGHGDVLTRLVSAIKRQHAIPRKTPGEGSEIHQGARSGEARAGSPPERDSSTREQPQPQPQKPVPLRSLERQAQEKVNAWNAKYLVGTKVSSLKGGYRELETRTPAMVLFGHRAAVYMKGYNGYFDLDEISPITLERTGT